VLTNVEFDHADIFDDIGAIRRQFHHLVRTVPGSGLIVAPKVDDEVDAVLGMGLWTPVERFGPAPGAAWDVTGPAPDGTAFDVICAGERAGRVEWSLTGDHNVANALAAIAAARHAGVPPRQAVEALRGFRNVKRRMELVGDARGVRVYDDFAHHPTAIATTLEGLRRHVGERRILAVLEPRSNTMRMGVHSGTLAGSLAVADRVWVHAPDDLGWSVADALAPLGERLSLCPSSADIVTQVAAAARAGDQVLVMSNGGFEGIHGRLLDALRATAPG
jgi:UDP-N-acetylmuramate: L-alanyl-gamma-D-glutamyl-meso-diaminopimelate ligase